MSSNSIGKIFNFTTWGESHGKAIGCVIDGVPSKIPLNEKDLQKYLIKEDLDNQSIPLKEMSLIKLKFYQVYLKDLQLVIQYL